MKALVGAFNQEKALVGAFSVIIQPVVEPMDRFTALTWCQLSPASADRNTEVLCCRLWPTLAEARMTPGAEAEVSRGMERVLGYIRSVIWAMWSEHALSCSIGVSNVRLGGPGQCL